MAQDSERGVVTTGPGTVTITNPQMSPLTRLVLNDDRIKVRNGLFTRRIGWDQVRLFTDGSWRTRQIWALRIVRHNGRAITSAATADVGGWQWHLETVAAIRQAAEWHDIPATLTAHPRAREPLPESGPQRRWEDARVQARRASIWFAAWGVATVIAAAVMLAALVYTRSHPKANLPWYALGWWCVALIVPFTFAAWLGRRIARKQSQAARAAAEFARGQDSTPGPIGERVDGTAAAPVTCQPPAADATAAVRMSCPECGADSAPTARVCARCEAPLAP